METFQYGGGTRADRAFKRAVAISVAVHVALAGAFFVKSLIKPKPVLKRNVYLFEMTEPMPQYRERTPEPAREKKAEPAVERKKAKEKTKALSTKKEKKKEAVKETPREEPESAARESETTAADPVSIARPGFPFSFYEGQIFKAINRNWQPPEELLGADEQLVVVVRFEIQKDGSVTNVSIAESSWNSILDGLALRAVEKAQIPPIPGEDPGLTVSCRLVLKRR